MRKLSLPVLAMPILLGLSFAYAAYPQNGQKVAEKVEKTAVPVLPPLAKLKIRDEQHKIDVLQLQFDQYQQAVQNLQKQFSTEQTELNSLVEDAYKAANADKKAFSLDMDKLEFTPIAADPITPKPQG